MNEFRSEVKRYLMPYRQGRPPIFLFATPRGGSTWLAELIWSQPGMRFVNEPFNLRREHVAKALGWMRWRELYSGNDRQRFDSYLTALISGENRSSDVVALKQWRRVGWRWRTDRAILKIIHAGSDLMPWMCARFGGRAVLLLRHPLATAVSRKTFPFLEEVRSSHLFGALTPDQRALCHDVLRRNNRIEKGVLAWCLFVGPALKTLTPDVLVVTYEQLVLDPEPVLRALGGHLDLPDLSRMREALETPSLSSFLCDEASTAALDSRELSQRAKLLVSKWRRHVAANDEANLMESLRVFDIQAYKADDLLPAMDLWLGTKSDRAGLRGE